MELLWIFGEGGASGEPFEPKKAQTFISNTGVQFKVLIDNGFKVMMDAIDAGTEELPQQFIIDGRNMELIDIVTGVEQPAWPKLKELLYRD